MSHNRVVVTGIGVVSPFGSGRDPFWSHVSRGASGTRAITAFDSADLACQVAAMVPDEAIADVPAAVSGRGGASADASVNGRADPRRWSRVSAFRTASARLATSQACPIGKGIASK